MQGIRGLVDKEETAWRGHVEDFLHNDGCKSKVLKSQEEYDCIVQVISPGGWDKIPSKDKTTSDYRYIKDYLLVHRNGGM